MCRRFGIVAALALAFAGCGKDRPADKVAYVADDDPGMNAAMGTARANVNTFVAALQAPRPGQSAFSVKAAFADGGVTEHMWLMPVTYDGTNFQGVVNNEPEQITSVKMGATVTVGPDKISDWMYVERGKPVGGQTLRVLRDGFTPAERAEFDKSVPFVVE